DNNKKAAVNKPAGNVRDNFAKNYNNGQKPYGGQRDNYKAGGNSEPKKGPVGGCYNCGKDHYANQCPLKKDDRNQQHKIHAAVADKQAEKQVTPIEVP
ncbi:hypothetical protein KI387_028919, partial [Taxus chinensis]